MKQEYDFSRAERGKFFHPTARPHLPVSEPRPEWEGAHGPLGRFIVQEAKKTLQAYRVQPSLVSEHANQEHDAAHGGHAHRQLFELVQSSADALSGASREGSILIRLTETHLYCADNGRPIDEQGVEALMFAHMSSKRNTSETGRFGLGFESMLGVTDTPEFFCRAGSFRFDRKHAGDRIGNVCSVSEPCPILRLPEPIDPRAEMDRDEELQELSNWATTIVRLPLKTGARDDLARQVQDFPPEFLLFVEHVRHLTLEDEGAKRSRSFILEKRGGELHLDTGEKITRWLRCKRTHRLSYDTQGDRRPLDDRGEAPIWWAAPLDGLNEPGVFWAFLPTRTTSLLAGILNAPWKTNEDRLNLLPGPYNDELIDAAAEMIAEALPKLATREDPARHLDALPRRHQARDPEQADRLRERLFRHLDDREIVPDQAGKLRMRRDVSYPPEQLTRRDPDTTPALERWAAYPNRPQDWLHHRALTRTRLAAIDRLFAENENGFRRQGFGPLPGAPRATIAAWLEALVNARKDDAVQASRTAVKIAGLIPSRVIRTNDELGRIVLTATEGWSAPVPDHLFLPDDTGLVPDAGTANQTSYVHRELMSDPDTLSALRRLGLERYSIRERIPDGIEE